MLSFILTVHYSYKKSKMLLIFFYLEVQELHAQKKQQHKTDKSNYKRKTQLALENDIAYYK